MRRMIAEDHKGSATGDLDGLQLSTSLASVFNPLSTITEAYRQLRARLLLSNGGGTRLVLVTSASMGEGKSVTAANLAIVFAQAGHRTLLLDADLRRPKVATMFGMNGASGLSDILAGRTEYSTDRIRTGIDNLYVLPSGEPEAYSAEMLSSKKFRQFVALLREEFEVIIMDSPPTRAVADPIMLSSISDGVLFVTRAGITKETELKESLDSLQSVGANVVGLVLNGFDLSMAYGYRYKYKDYREYSQYSRKGYYTYTD